MLDFLRNTPYNLIMKIHQNDSSIRKHYVTLRKSSPTLNVKLLYAGNICSNEEISTEAHHHAFWEIIYFHSGNGAVEIADSLYPVKKGCAVVYKKNSRHREIGFRGGIDGKFFAIKASKTLEDFCSTLSSPVIQMNDDDIFPLFATLVSLSSTGTAFSTRAAESLAKSVIYLLMEYSGYSATSGYGNALDGILKHLDDSFTKKINFTELCKSFGIDRYYLCVLFKERLGLTPVEYVTEKRINLARDLLKKGWSVSKAAAYCGYDSAYYFSKVFKKVTGYAPSFHKDK